MIKSKLIVITQLGQETLSEEWLNFKTISIKHLQSLIYDILPSMYHHEDYKIYWRYDETNFFEIYDYFSLYTALFLMSEKVLYMVVRDVYWWNVKDVDRLDGEVDAVSAVARDQLTTLKFYTVDFRQRFLVIAALKKGFPKEREKLLPPPETSVPVKPLVKIDLKKGKTDKKKDKKPGKKGKK